MNLSTPSGCRDEAQRQQRLAAEAKGNPKQAQRHLDRELDLIRLAAKLEQDEAKEGTA